MTKQSQRGEYTAENRDKAIKMVTEWGMTNKKAAEQLGCSVESVRRWVSEYRKTIQPVQVQEELDLVKKFQAAQKPDHISCFTGKANVGEALLTNLNCLSYRPSKAE